MLRTLLVGFGRAGSGLHWKVLRRLRSSAEGAGLFSPEPPVVWDMGDVWSAARHEPLVVAKSLTHAARIADPGSTIVHLCVPPNARPAALRDVAALGFRRILAEKPLAPDTAGVRAVERIRAEHGLRLMTVSHWLQSALTRRLAQLVDSADLGQLRRIGIAQRKPRLSRTLRDEGHPTAFDVELPHSVGLVLHLAGDADIAEAACTDLRVGDRVVPGMGTARLVLDHHSGPVTEIFSDLTSPVRERRVELIFDDGRVVGHFPASEDDHYAHITESGRRGQTSTVLFDEALGSFLLRAYQRFATGDDLDADFALAVRVVELLDAGKQLCRPVRAGRVGAPPVLDGRVEAAVPGLGSTPGGWAVGHGD
jgi:predicted dehydrogenase